MKLGVASDLHLDFKDMNREFFDWRGDVLLLAGDLGEEDYLRKHGHEFFDRVSKMATWVLYIVGNHEYYRSELDVAEGHLDVFLEQWSNIIMLRNSSFKVDHVDFFGATMWTDFHGSPLAELRAGSEMNDYRQIRIKGLGYRKIRPSDIVQQNQRGKNALLDFLERDTGGLRVVMTHHAPSMQSIPARYKHDYELNKAYCNNYDTLILNSKIDVWAHGHTHDFFDYEIGDTRVLCNPRGYPGERPAHLPPYQPVSFYL